MLRRLGPFAVGGSSALVFKGITMFELSHVYFVGDEDAPAEVPASACTGAKAPKRNARLVREPPLPRLKAKEVCEPVSPLINWVLEQSGLDPVCYQPKALGRRLGACLRALRAENEQDAFGVLRRKPEMLSLAVSALLIGVSGFFRDEAVFEHLEQHVLPGLLSCGAEVNVCSAGCSGGHELYSVAILLDELGGLERTQMLGLDCREEAIEQARSGVYNHLELAGLPNGRRERFFGLQDGCGMIVTRLRERIQWRTADLLTYAGNHLWDLILFRNVAIYLRPEHAGIVWRALERQLKPGGVLVSGKAERPPSSLQLRRETACIYRKPFLNQ